MIIMPLKSDYNHIICIMEGETKNIRFVLKIYRFVLRLLNISFCGLYIKEYLTYFNNIYMIVYERRGTHANVNVVNLNSATL